MVSGCTGRGAGDRLDTLAAGLRHQGGPALVLESHITDEQQATDDVARTAAELGRLDTLINNAGVMLLGPAVGAPLPGWQPATATEQERQPSAGRCLRTPTPFARDPSGKSCTTDPAA